MSFFQIVEVNVLVIHVKGLLGVADFAEHALSLPFVCVYLHRGLRILTGQVQRPEVLGRPAA